MTEAAKIRLGNVLSSGISRRGATVRRLVREKNNGGRADTDAVSMPIRRSSASLLHTEMENLLFVNPTSCMKDIKTLRKRFCQRETVA